MENQFQNLEVLEKQLFKLKAKNLANMLTSKNIQFKGIQYDTELLKEIEKLENQIKNIKNLNSN